MPGVAPVAMNILFFTLNSMPVLKQVGTQKLEAASEGSSPFLGFAGFEMLLSSLFPWLSLCTLDPGQNLIRQDKGSHIVQTVVRMVKGGCRGKRFADALELAALAWKGHGVKA